MYTTSASLISVCQHSCTTYIEVNIYTFFCIVVSPISFPCVSVCALTVIGATAYKKLSTRWTKKAAHRNGDRHIFHVSTCGIPTLKTFRTRYILFLAFAYTHTHSAYVCGSTPLWGDAALDPAQSSISPSCVTRRSYPCLSAATRTPFHPLPLRPSQIRSRYCNNY